MNEEMSKFVNKILSTILDKGYLISVTNGEGYAIRRSSSLEEIKKNLGSTDADWLVIRCKDGEKIGWILLIWGNDPDGSDLIADHSDNDEINRLVDMIMGEEEMDNYGLKPVPVDKRK